LDANQIDEMPFPGLKCAQTLKMAVVDDFVAADVSSAPTSSNSPRPWMPSATNKPKNTK
jgi:hypothetical protein